MINLTANDTEFIKKSADSI